MSGAKKTTTKNKTILDTKTTNDTNTLPTIETPEIPPQIEPQPYSKEEMDKALVLIDKYGITPAEQVWFYDLYNRVFKADKRPGCGKCFSNDAKIFRIKYKQIYS
jgi:hypothetical protein